MKLKSVHVLRFTAILAAILLAVVILGGCGDFRDDWVRQTIEQYYYRFDGDYSSIEDMQGLTVEEMVAKLDIYSAYYTREEYAATVADNAGSKSGIGVTYTYADGAGVVIQSVVGNSPAKHAGLKAGDVFVSASAGDDSVQFAALDDFSSFVSARDTGEEITLTYAGGGTVTLAREEYTASYASMYTRYADYEIEYSGKSMDLKQYKGGISELPEGTAYIYLSQFYGNAADEMGLLIGKFNTLECDTLILDLRDDGGGYVDVMAKIGGRFTSSVTADAVAMTARYKSGYEDIEYCKNYTENIVPAGTKVYAMANHNTASASEALLGVLISYGILDYENVFLSQYAGLTAKSYGKGIMQSTFVNKLTGEALKLTVAGIYWGNGTTIHDKGLTVDDGCSLAPASDTIVSIGMDDELLPVIEKIIADRVSHTRIEQHKVLGR